VIFEFNFNPVGHAGSSFEIISSNPKSY